MCVVWTHSAPIPCLSFSVVEITFQVPFIIFFVCLVKNERTEILSSFRNRTLIFWIKRFGKVLAAANLWIYLWHRWFEWSVSGRWVADDERQAATKSVDNVFFARLRFICISSFGFWCGANTTYTTHTKKLIIFGHLIDVNAPAMYANVYARSSMWSRDEGVLWISAKKDKLILANLIIGFRYIARSLASRAPSRKYSKMK